MNKGDRIRAVCEDFQARMVRVTGNVRSYPETGVEVAPGRVSAYGFTITGEVRVVRGKPCFYVNPLGKHSSLIYNA